MTGDSATMAPAYSRRLPVSSRDMVTLVGLAIIVAACAGLSDVFLTERNLVDILQQSSIDACIAIGVTLVIISGSIDLSVGHAAALTAVALGIGVLIYTGGNPAIGIPGTLRQVFQAQLGAAEPALGNLWELEAIVPGVMRNGLTRGRE